MSALRIANSQPSASAIACALTLFAMAIGGIDGASAEPKPLVLLVSVDGFRADYLVKSGTPTLNRLAETGARATGLVPIFPSLTFPSHYSMVTGRRPDAHGVVHNQMFDPERPGRPFAPSLRTEVGDAFWWKGAKPIWVTAAQQGKTAATLFWPGSEAEIDGIRPGKWLPYQPNMSSMERVHLLLEWLKPEDRPDFATLYFSEVDVAGHIFGPESREVEAAIARVDLALKVLLTGLQLLGLDDATTLIVVSDHGMAEVSLERQINVSQHLAPFETAKIVWSGALAGFIASEDEAPALTAALDAHAHLRCWLKEKVPAEYGFGTNKRIPPVLCLADLGWQVTTAMTFGRLRGMHGYDPREPSMWGLLIAHGLRIRQTELGLVNGLDVYPLLCELIGLKPEPNEGGMSAMSALKSAGADGALR